ncbi:GDSL-type esterase/lipase family protein [Marinilongibacter aquaticus]|uniref:glycosyl hydrolase family 28 protein n=1 Tax=Marinilongibacter aquaticus TaxID=2975157 RepID=UPI0021BD6FBA|nr:glycosyl hydrolase family 28 protein [Marinilongibacter aquaticus]UBM57564.1 GDSL-type esterase/lipase family protein [Marinilongibacter aquaticus]
MKFPLYLLTILTLLAFQPEKTGPRVFMIGDSTMANKNSYDAPETGWGQVFHELFSQTVSIHNHAKNGRSTKSFRTEGLWATVEKQLQAGDYVFIQFGHNDQKTQDSSRYAAPRTDYKANLIRYIEETKAKGAFPILLTPVSRRKFDSGQFVDQHGEYPDVVREIAQNLHIPLLDMHKKSMDLLKTMGEEESADLYMNLAAGLYPKFPNGLSDNTHFTPYGARVMAKLAAEALVETNTPLKNFLKDSPFPKTKTYQLPTVNTVAFKPDTFDIRDYGAESGGEALCHKAINAAISIASKQGGGVVLVPSGFWLSGPIEMKSNVNLHLAEGAFVQFSDNRNDYPIVKTTWEGQKAYRCQAPISGFGLKNIALTGKGILDGAGQVWKQVKKSKLTESQWQSLLQSGGVLNDAKDTWYPSASSKLGNDNASWAGKISEGKVMTDYEKVRDYLRPNMVSLNTCRNVLIEGLTFLNSPAWTLHPLLCKHISIVNVNVKNPWYGQNNDAIDLESCTYGILDGCTFDTGDDAITIKSGRDAQGRARGVATSHFIITNTTVFHGHGGFVIGSEMSGGVHHLYVNNCNFLGTDIGLRFKTTRGRGGVVEDIFISDINMNNILGDAIRFNMYYEAKDPVPLAGEQRGLPTMEAKTYYEGTPTFRNFFIERVYCKGAETAIMMQGIPESRIENIHIANTHITAQNGVKIYEAKDIGLKNVHVFSRAKDKVLQINNVENLKIDGLEYSPDKNVFIEINGKQSQGISIRNTSKKGVKKVSEQYAGAAKNSLLWKE